MHARAWRFHILRANRKSIKWTWTEPFEMNVKIKQESNFVIDNDSQLFFDAQEAKKVGIEKQRLIVERKVLTIG